MVKRVAMWGTVGLCLLLSDAAYAQLPGVQRDDVTPQSERTPDEVIEAQLEAFNAHSADGMVNNLHEDFAWFAVDSDVMTLEMQGRARFHESMRDYFNSIPGARAEIEEMFVVGNFVTARERAYWIQNGLELSQASLAVYEIRYGLIYRVWYYPASE